MFSNLFRNQNSIPYLAPILIKHIFLRNKKNKFFHLTIKSIREMKNKLKINRIYSSFFLINKFFLFLFLRFLFVSFLIIDFILLLICWFLLLLISLTTLRKVNDVLNSFQSTNNNTITWELVWKLFIKYLHKCIVMMSSCFSFLSLSL